MNGRPAAAAAAAARECIERLRADNPSAVRLATLVSTAMRVEPKLLRQCRLLLADADVTAEADLWCSDLLSGATPVALTLRPEVARMLRPELAAMPAELRAAAISLVSSAHGDRHWSVRLEERVNELEVTGGQADVRAQEDLLLAAIGELTRATRDPTSGPQVSVDIARWLLSALARLPAHLAQTEAGVAAGAASSVHLDHRIPPADGRPDGEREQWLSWLLSAGTLGPDVPVGIRFTPGRLELNTYGPDVATVPLPNTDPVVVDLGVRGADGVSRTRLALSPGAPVVVPVDADEVSLTSIDGRRWTVCRAGVPHTAGFDFTSVRAALRPCLAREKEVSSILGSIRSAAWTVICGPPGTGTSTVLNAAIDQLRAGADTALALHFLGFEPTWDDPVSLTSSLQAQLEVVLGPVPQLDLAAGVGDPAQRLSEVLIRAGDLAARSGKSVVVAIDGLRGDGPAGAGSALAQLPLPSQPPPGVHLLVSIQASWRPDLLGAQSVANLIDLGALPTEQVCQAMVEHAAPLITRALRPDPPKGGPRTGSANDRMA